MRWGSDGGFDRAGDAPWRRARKQMKGQLLGERHGSRERCAASTGASVVQSSSRPWLGLLELLLLGSGVVVVLAGRARAPLIIPNRELGDGRDLVLKLVFGALDELLFGGVLQWALLAWAPDVPLNSQAGCV